MAINLSGYWKSVDNKNLSIKSDEGFYKITQTATKIVVIGINKKKQWDNAGFSIQQSIIEINENDEIELYWTDTVSSTSPEKAKDHICKIKIIDCKHIEVISNNYNNKFSFGTWEKITEDDYKKGLGIENVN